MSPFAKHLKELRIARGLRQIEFADLVGYEQSYVSALELGIKGPPTTEFVENLITSLGLSAKEKEALEEIVAGSKRKFTVPHEASEDVFWLCANLEGQLDRLHPIQIQLIKTALSLPLNCNLPGSEVPVTRIKRRKSSQKHKKLEAEMK